MLRTRTHPAFETSDDDVLAELGIKPELSRRVGPFGNFAISFSVICILAGGMSLFGYGMGHGGPMVMLGSWSLIGFMTLLVGRPGVPVRGRGVAARADACSPSPRASRRTVSGTLTGR